LKRLPFLFFGLSLLAVNLAVPVLLQELNITEIIQFSEREVFNLSGLVGIPVGAAAICLVYMRSRDAGRVHPFFWIWLLASIISVGCYYLSFLSSSTLNVYFYSISDLVCLGIGVYLVFVPSLSQKSGVKTPSLLDNSRSSNSVLL